MFWWLIDDRIMPGLFGVAMVVVVIIGLHRVTACIAGSIVDWWWRRKHRKKEANGK